MQSVCWFGSYKHILVSRWISKYRIHEKWSIVLLFLSYHLYASEYKTAQTLTEFLDPFVNFLRISISMWILEINPTFPKLNFSF